MRTIVYCFLALLMTTPALAASPCATDPACTPALVDSVIIEEETAGFEIDIAYPVLCSEEATRTIRDAVLNGLNEFKMLHPHHDRTDFPHRYTMGTQYTVQSAANGRLASVLLHVSVYTGGAHGNHWPTTWLFEMNRGRQVFLSDIVIDVEQTLHAITPMVRQILRDKLKEWNAEEMLLDGTGPVLSNYENFLVSDEGLTFYFAHYQVAPFAAGEQTAFIPWASIQELIRPEFMAILPEPAD